MNLSVIGGGAFGTAISCTLAHTASNISIIVRDEMQANSINKTHRNSQYFPDYKLPKNIRATTTMTTVSDSDAVFLAVPTHSLENICANLKNYIKPETIVVNLAKGLHAEHFTLDKFLSACLPGQPLACLKGPNFARPLMYGNPSGMTLAVSQPEDADSIRAMFQNSAIVLESWADISAIEFISAIKNVFAIIMGISDATDDNPNTRFMVVQLILKEANNLLQMFGFDPKVLFTFAGCGDLLMTALNDSSRNRTLGLLIGRGFEFATSGTGPVMEGRRTIGLINKHLKNQGNNHPIIIDLERVFEQQLTPQEFFKRIIQ